MTQPDVLMAVTGSYSWHTSAREEEEEKEEKEIQRLMLLRRPVY